MGQAECLTLLERHKKVWWTSKEVAESLGQGRGCTTNNLSKLSKSGFISRKIERGNNYFYKAK